MAVAVVELEVGGRPSGSRTRTRCCSPTRGSRSAISPTTTSPSATASSGRSASGRRSSGAFPTGSSGEAIYQKRVPEKRPDWIEVARVTFPSGRHADELCVTELAHVIWGANLAVVDFHPWPSRRQRHRAPGRAAHRHRPAAGHDVRGRQARRGDRPRGARRDRLRRLAEDVGQPRHPHRLPDRAALGVPRRPPRRARVRARGRAPRTRPRDDRVVEGGAGREGLHRLQPERARPDDRLGLLGARPARRRPSRRR